MVVKYLEIIIESNGADVLKATCSFLFTGFNVKAIVMNV